MQVAALCPACASTLSAQPNRRHAGRLDRFEPRFSAGRPSRCGLHTVLHAERSCRGGLIPPPKPLPPTMPTCLQQLGGRTAVPSLNPEPTPQPLKAPQGIHLPTPRCKRAVRPLAAGQVQFSRPFYPPTNAIYRQPTPFQADSKNLAPFQTKSTVPKEEYEDELEPSIDVRRPPTPCHRSRPPPISLHHTPRRSVVISRVAWGVLWGCHVEGSSTRNDGMAVKWRWLAVKWRWLVGEMASVGG